jgi:tetratricopeptide (TPR) repeat protein
LNLREQMAYTLHDLYGAYSRTGRMEEACRANTEARALWKELGNMPMYIDSLGQISVFWYAMGDYAQGLAASDEAFAVGAEIGHGYGQSACRVVASMMVFDQGDPARAIEIDEEARQLGMPTNYPGAHIVLPANLTWLYGSLGLYDRAEAYARAAIDYARDHLPILLPWPMAVLMRVLVQKGDLDAARELLPQMLEADMGDISYFRPSAQVKLAAAEYYLAQGNLEQALEYAEAELVVLVQQLTRAWNPDTLYVKGVILARMNQPVEARSVMVEALAEADALNSQRMRWRILAALAEMTDDPAERDRLMGEAREVIHFIAERTPTPEAKTSFLNLPHVHRVLADSK